MRTPYLSLTEVLDWHYLRYPEIRAVDLYKLLHQGVYGPRHLTGSSSDIRERLFVEIDRLRVTTPNTSDSNVPPPAPWEPLDPAGHIVRINLLPLLNTPQRLEQLVAVLIESAHRITGNPTLLADRLAATVQWSRVTAPHLTHPIERIVARATTRGYPAIHHSALYRRRYRPAYRVVLAELWQD